MENSSLIAKSRVSLILCIHFLYLSCSNTDSLSTSQAVDSANKIDVAEKVFFFGPSIDSAVAAISAECDCCGSDMLFRKDSTFFFISYCLEGDTYSKGKYSVRSNKLILFYDGLNITELHDLGSDDSTQSKAQYEISMGKYFNVTAEISFLKNHLVIKTTSGTESEYAMESKELSRLKFLANLKTDSAWIKLLSK